MNTNAQANSAHGKTHCLGLIGGIGIGAAVFYYENLAKECEARGRSLDMVMAHAETPRILQFLQSGDRVGLAEYVNGFVRRLQAAGAEVIGIPSVTTHFCLQEVRAASPLPLIDIFQPLTRAILARKIARVILFGTRFVVESQLFRQIENVEFVLPRPEELEYIHKTYVDIAMSGKGSLEQHAGLTAMAHRIIERDKVDAIVMGGTDLVVLFNQSNCDFPALDCAALHVQAIAERICGDIQSNLV